MKIGAINIGISLILGLLVFNCTNKQEVVTTKGMTLRNGCSSPTFTTVKNFGIPFPEASKRPINTNIYYLVRGRHLRSTTKEKLQKAETLSDIIPDYPSSWITGYTSVEISSTYNNKKISATNQDDILSVEQKNILKAADISAKIDFVIKYQTKNSITNTIYDEQMDVVLGIVPDIEAEYIGGYDQLIIYLTANGNDEINAYLEGLNADADRVNLNIITVLFTINVKGEITDVLLANSSGNNDIDTSMVELISSMPKWHPAKNANGSRVSQEFELIFSVGGC